MYRFIKNFFISTLLLLMLVSCSSTTNEAKTVGVSKNNNLLAQISYDNKIYSIEGNLTPDRKIQQQVGRVENIVAEAILFLDPLTVMVSERRIDIQV